MRRLDLAGTSSTSPASTASSISPASPACGASATSSRSTSATTCSRRNACSRRRSATASASCSPPRRRSTAAERSSDARGDAAAAASPYGITKLTCEHLADAYARASASTRSCCATSTRSGRASAPDMAFTKVGAARSRPPVPALRRRGAGAAGRTSPTSSTRRSRHGGARRAHAQRRRRRRGLDARGDRAARGPRRARARDRGTTRSPATSGGRTRTRPASAPSSAGAEGLARRRLAGQWEWASARVQRAEPCAEGRKPRSSSRPSRRSTSDATPATIAARWWLLVVGAVLGALIGFLFSLSDGKIYKATAQVYLGQPLAPAAAAVPPRHRRRSAIQAS